VGPIFYHDSSCKCAEDRHHAVFGSSRLLNIGRPTSPARIGPLYTQRRRQLADACWTRRRRAGVGSTCWPRGRIPRGLASPWPRAEPGRFPRRRSHSNQTPSCHARRRRELGSRTNDPAHAKSPRAIRPVSFPTTQGRSPNQFDFSCRRNRSSPMRGIQRGLLLEQDLRWSRRGLLLRIHRQQDPGPHLHGVRNRPEMVSIR